MYVCVRVCVRVCVCVCVCVWDFPGGSVVKNPPLVLETQETQDPSLGQRKWQPIPVFLSGKSYGHRSLAGYSPQAGKRVGHDLATKQYRHSHSLINQHNTMFSSGFLLFFNSMVILI